MFAFVYEFLFKRLSCKLPAIVWSKVNSIICLWREVSREKLQVDAGNFFCQFLKYALYMQNKLCLVIKQQIYNLILPKRANCLHCK